MLLLTSVLLLYFHSCILCYGFDSGGDQSACGRQYRSGRMHRPPCDLAGDGYCTSAGTGYPWHAVKRFVRENQGLMRRMYGDQRHGQVLKAELDEVEYNDVVFQSENRKVHSRQDFDYNLDNDIYPRDFSEPRFLKDEEISNDDVLNTKFIYSEEPSISIKVGDLRTAPHFRPTATTVKAENSEKTSSQTIETLTTTTSKEDSSTVTESSTTESIVETTTGQNVINAKLESTTSSTSSTLENTSESSKAEAVLFQDMMDEEQDKDKVKVNYQVRGINACPAKEEVVAPFWANNTRGEVLALLNMYPFEQYVHWEKCTHEHRQMYCRDGCKCEQQYRLHRLLAYDPNNECRGIFSDWFRFPSCCICKCYNIGAPAEFRVTSRSPRANNERVLEGLPDWYRRKHEAIFANSADHG